MTINLKELPLDALIDTNVLIRFLDERVDADTPACKAFCNAMIDEGRQLWVAAPTIAEVCRQAGKPVPRFKGIAVVPFDDRAAEILGMKMPMAKLHETKTASGVSLTYLKYDAMIAACALRVRTGTIVALDGDHVVLAKGLSIDVRRPESYALPQPPQLVLPLETPAADGAAAGGGEAGGVAVEGAAPVAALPKDETATKAPVDSVAAGGEAGSVPAENAGIIHPKDETATKPGAGAGGEAGSVATESAAVAAASAPVTSGDETEQADRHASG